VGPATSEGALLNTSPNDMAKGKKKKQATTNAPDDDDALLAAAMSQAAEERVQVRLAEEKARAAQLAAAQLGMQEQMEPQMRIQHLVGRMNEVPTFGIMTESENGKRFVPMRFDDGDAGSAAGPQVCAFFLDPDEARRTLAQAQQAVPELRLVIGAIPLGHAFSLVVGWAEAKGDAPFTIRGSASLTKDVRQHVQKQLESAGLPAYWQIPVILCDELCTPTVVPVFLTHEGLSACWKAAGREGPPPKTLKIVDLRLLVPTMLEHASQSALDWRNVRFLGCENGSRALKHGLDELEASGGIGSGHGSGDRAALEAEAALNVAALQAKASLEAAVKKRADPESEPPPLLATPPPPSPMVNG